METSHERPHVYVDVNVFIYPILYDPTEIPEANGAKIFLHKIIANEVAAHTSLLSWDEFVWVLRKQINPEFATEKGLDFLAFPNLTFESVTLETINYAQDLIGLHAIKPRDAIHLATAMLRNLTEIVTFDNDLDKI